jgi:glutaredoxin
MAAKVEIYIWTTCPFCVRAKSLLKSKSIDFIEYNLDGDEIARDKMSQRANGNAPYHKFLLMIFTLVVVMISIL